MTDPPIHSDATVGGDVVAGNKTVIQQAGGDIVGRDKITYEAPAVGIAALRQLPPPPADFTGRAAELAELRQGWRGRGAAIGGLRGLGGVGKTTLALVLAHELADEYPDAQIFVDLQGVSQPLAPEAVMAHVIRAYKPVEKLPDNAGQLAAIYRSVLAGQRALLLFDNARDAAQVLPLIPPPGCLLLVTSRLKFALPGLKAVNLESLPPADAQALLLKRAARIGAHAARLAALCGHLPMALTLAGSALAERDDLEPEQYALRLEHARLAVLDEVGASLALSYDLLAPELQRRWCWLSVFPAEFDAPAAAAVWSLEPDLASERLSDLLRYSLLEFNTGPKRYRLHDLARDLARARLSDAERAQAERRHAEHYLHVLSSADELYLQGGQHMLTGLALFDRERGNILAGQAWAAAQAEQDEAAARLTSDFAALGAYVLSLRQHPRDRLRWLQAAVAAAHRFNNSQDEAIHVGNLGLAFYDLGQTRQAIACFEQALGLMRALGNRRGEGAALGNLGLAFANLGEPRRAIEFYEQQLAIVRAIGDRRSEGAALGNLGGAYRHLGEPGRAITFYEQRLVIARETGDRRGEGNALGNLGNAQADLGEPRRAIEFYEQQVVMAREIGDQRGEGQALGNLGTAYASLGEPRRAIEFYEQQLAIVRAIGDRLGESNASWNLGDEYARQGDFGRAAALMQFTVDYERELGHPEAEADAAMVEALRKRLRGG